MKRRELFKCTFPGCEVLTWPVKGFVHGTLRRELEYRACQLWAAQGLLPPRQEMIGKGWDTQVEVAPDALGFTVTIYLTGNQ